MSLSSGGRLLPAALLLGLACAPATHVLDEGRERPGSSGAGQPAAPPGATPDRASGPLAPPPGPPELLRFTVSLAADCVRVQAEASTPVTAEIRFQAAGQTDVRPLGAGASLFDQAFRLALPAGAMAE